MIEAVPAWVAQDREWRAALHVLDSPILARKRVRQYVDFNRQRIDFPALQQEAGAWSDGERLMLNLAHDLFNEGARASVGELARELDDDNLRIALEAIQLFRQ